MSIERQHREMRCLLLCKFTEILPHFCLLHTIDIEKNKKNVYNDCIDLAGRAEDGK